jgi:hypothetical protein
MKDDIPRLIPIWLLPFLILGFVLAMQCSCRTGGRTLNTNSSGIKSVVSPSDLIRQPNGTYKIKPQTKQVELPPAISNPVIPEPQSAKAEDAPIKITPADSRTPFKPTVSSSKEQKLPPLKPKMNVKPVKPVKPGNLIEGDGGCVVVPGEGKPEGWCGTKDPKIAGPCEAEPPKEAVSVKWFELFLFYVVCAMGFLVSWLSYALYRDWRKKKGKK